MDTLRLTRAERGQARKAMNRLFARERKEFPSASSEGTVYVAMVHGDGHLSCNCRGWTIKKGDKPRRCKHTETLIAGRSTYHDEEYEYLTTTERE